MNTSVPNIEDILSMFWMPIIKLQSSDGKTFEVDVEVAKCSVTLKTMLEVLEMGDEEEVVPLPNVNSDTLEKIIEWATHHKDDPPPPEDDKHEEKRNREILEFLNDDPEPTSRLLGAGKSQEVEQMPNLKTIILRKIIDSAIHQDTPQGDEPTDDISSWDADFLKVDQGTLYQLIMAANYLDIKGLLHITTKTVVNMIKDKTTTEIRKIFNVRNDFTASEEERMREENEWCTGYRDYD